MATIIKRKTKYAVVYNHIDENGEKKQKWETWNTYKEALKRKAQVENDLLDGTFIAPSDQTVEGLLMILFHSTVNSIGVFPPMIAMWG